MSSHNEHALSGLKVLDLTRALAGPSCTRMLAEMGAEVTKIEPGPNGDLTRGLSKYRGERSLYFVQQNLRKKSVCLNMRHPEALPLIKSLVRHVDVVVENFKPGVMANMGLGYDDLCTIKSDIILCSISALGQTGPLAQKPGYDYIAQAYAGITSMIGDPDAPPYIPLAGLGDVSTGVHAALAITAALLHHARTGKGQHLDIGLLDVYYHCHEVSVHQYSGTNGDIEPTRGGRHMNYIAPAGIFRGTGGEVLIMAFMHHWKDLCAVMQQPDLETNPKFTDDQQRLENLDELVMIIESWLSAFDDIDTPVSLMEVAGVPCAPILSVADTVDHPHLVARGTVRVIEDELAGRFCIPGNPLRFSAFPDPLAGQAPTLGQHNRDVLANVLDKSQPEIDALYDSGLLVERRV